MQKKRYVPGTETKIVLVFIIIVHYNKIVLFIIVGRQWDAEAVGCTAGLCNISGRGEGAGRTTPPIKRGACLLCGHPQG